MIIEKNLKNLDQLFLLQSNLLKGRDKFLWVVSSKLLRIIMVAASMIGVCMCVNFCSYKLHTILTLHYHGDQKF